MSDLDVGNLLGLVIVGGVATKMVDNMGNRNDNHVEHHMKNSHTKIHRHLHKKAEENAYTRERATFSNKYNPF